MQIHENGERMLNVDCHDLHSYNSELYKKLIKYPNEIISIMDGAVKALYADIVDVQAEDVEIQVGVYPCSTKLLKP